MPRKRKSTESTNNNTHFAIIEGWRDTKPRNVKPCRRCGKMYMSSRKNKAFCKGCTKK